jgi:electron transfer flavoprotein beta subunit
MLKIVVCMKQVLDPEAPSSAFKVDEQANKVIPPAGVPPVLNPFDENALEIALKIKDSQEASVTVISMGKGLAKAVVKKPLAAGADELVLLDDEALAELDSYTTARALTLAIQKLGECDVILCGREAADTDAGQVGPGIAQMLGIPCVAFARKAEVADGKVKVERVVSDGYEVVESPLPVVITASSEAGELRMAPLKAVIEAQKKQPIAWTAQDIGFDGAAGRTSLKKLYIPAHEGQCDMVTGETPEEAGANLAAKIKDAGII